jgi:hypothetical protein
VLGAVTAVCGGSADRVKAFDPDVFTRTRLGALAAPTDLAVGPGKVTGEVLAPWLGGPGTHGFLVQHASDPTKAATISAPVPCTKQKLTLAGLPAGASVSFRVAAIDPTSRPPRANPRGACGPSATRSSREANGGGAGARQSPAHGT